MKLMSLFYDSMILHSHTYVKLDEVATKVGFKAADEVAKEMFDCSKDLYNSDANPRYSPFPTQLFRSV